MSYFSELLKKKNWRIWLKALVAAAISGGAIGGAAAIASPPFSFGKVFWQVVVAAIGGVFLYLKDRPMPVSDVDDGPI